MRIEDLEKQPSFEARANLFIQDVEALIPDFPNLVIVPKNKTLRELENGPSAIDWMEREYPEYAKDERIRDRDLEIESSYMNTVSVVVGAQSKKEINEFLRVANSIAKDLGGRLRPGGVIKDHKSQSYTFRFDVETLYDFD